MQGQAKTKADPQPDTWVKAQADAEANQQPGMRAKAEAEAEAKTKTDRRLGAEAKDQAKAETEQHMDSRARMRATTDVSGQPHAWTDVRDGEPANVRAHASASASASARADSLTAALQHLKLHLIRPLCALAITTAVFVVVMRSAPRPATHGTGLWVALAMVGAIAGLLAAVAWIDQARPNPMFAAGIALAALCSFALVWLQPLGNAGLTGIATTMVLLVACLRQRPWLQVSVPASTFVLLVAESSYRRPLPASLTLCFPILAISALTVLVQRLRDAKVEAETLLEQVEANRHVQAEAAALAERQHLAREMHDVLAHSLSGLMLHLEGARMLASSSPTDPRLPLAVDRAHELAKEGLTEARNAIGMLRDEQLPGPEALHTLTEQFERHSGIPCALTMSGQPLPIRPDARLSVYRVAQEALTNVVKHSHAERVEVRLDYAADRVNLTIEDFGTDRYSADQPSASALAVSERGHDLGRGRNHGDGHESGREHGSGHEHRRESDREHEHEHEKIYGLEPGHLTGVGYGLTGMRERAELLGGTLAAAATATGFRVELQVPA